MFDETSSELPDESVIIFDDPKAAGNKALFTLLTARIDKPCQDMIRPFNGLGGKAMQQLFTRFAPITQIDTDHFHQQFCGGRCADKLCHFNYATFFKLNVQTR